MQGYPSIEFVNTAGDRVGATVGRVPDQQPLVMLAPGQTATALLVQMNVGIYLGCAYPAQTTSSSTLRVSPPGGEKLVSVPLRSNVCRSPSLDQSAVTPVEVTTP